MMPLTPFSKRVKIKIRSVKSKKKKLLGCLMEEKNDKNRVYCCCAYNFFKFKIEALSISSKKKIFQSC